MNIVLRTIRLARSPYTVFLNPLIPPVRTLSIWSNFRFPFTRKKQNQSETDIETQNLWSEAVREFKEKHLDSSHGSLSYSLSRTEMRKIKKAAFLHAIDTYVRRHGKSRRGYHQFAENALNQMSAFEVTEDLDCYKAIIRLFPVKRMVVKRFLQAESGHFMKQQDLMIKILSKMNVNYTMADDEVGQLIIDIFGWRSHAMQHYRHMMYWLPKLSNSNPFPVQWNILDDLDLDPLRLALLIAERICRDKNTEMKVVQLTKDSVIAGQPSSMISAQSPEQRALLSHVVYGMRPTGRKQYPVVYIDGPHSVWYQRLQAAYYTMWADIDRNRIAHSLKEVVFDDLERDRIDVCDLPVFGHLHPLLDVPKIPVKLLNSRSDSNIPQLHVNPGTRVTSFDMNANALKHPSCKLPRCQPEYDGRWESLRQTHTYKFLPRELTKHEQLEGVVLALGVVTPIGEALDNQSALYRAIIERELNPEGPVGSDTFSQFSKVPALAPSSLLKSWINTLQAQNPCLSDATIIIRASTTDESPPNSEQANDEECARKVSANL